MYLIPSNLQYFDSWKKRKCLKAIKSYNILETNFYLLTSDKGLHVSFYYIFIILS